MVAAIEVAMLSWVSGNNERVQVADLSYPRLSIKALNPLLHPLNMLPSRTARICFLLVLDSVFFLLELVVGKSLSA
jgi:hypothetical protein